MIAHFTRSYGSTMLLTDAKAISQFIKKGIVGENIVLKSKGDRYYFYTYVNDAVAGLFTILFNEDCGAAYNVADVASEI